MTARGSESIPRLSLCFLSAFARKELDPGAILDLAQSLGYDAVELAPEPLWPKSASGAWRSRR
jgi:sugar phosphate isomerase/epimerase